MKTAKITVFNPVPSEQTYAYVMVEVFMDGERVTGREYDPEDFPQLSDCNDHFIDWLKEQEVEQATVEFISLKAPIGTSEGYPKVIGEPTIFNPQSDYLDIGILASNLVIAEE